MATDGPEMFFFPSNNKPIFSGLQRGNLYALCTFSHTTSAHMPPKIISQRKTIENMFYSRVGLDR